jgi:hypothetical protein
MDRGMRGKWWKAGALATVIAALVVALAHVGVPWAAGRFGHPLLLAMAGQAHWLNWAAVLLLAIGWGDSAIAYRVRRRRPS